MLCEKFYISRFKNKERRFNKRAKLPDYFGNLIGDKKKVLIAEIGSGPINTIGTSWPDTEVVIYASDVLWPLYTTYWEQHGKTPIVPIEYQDMEKLSYPDRMFDIVHCVNALDHTKDVQKAISEMKRVCARGGYVYLRHTPDQKKTYKGHHHWNAGFDTVAFFDNGKSRIELPEFKTEWKVFPFGKVHDVIVSIWQKPL